MNKIAFVILHYCTLQDTIDCIFSIKDRIDTENYEIIIVDNCSPDGSGRQLEKYYKDETKVTILHNNCNLGFAKGNNVGFRYAKNKLHCNFIVLLNSDTLLLSDNFFQLIEQEYLESSFAVLGPLIKTPNDKNTSNPGRDSVMSIKELQSFIWKIRIRLILNQLYIEFFYNNILLFLKKMNKNFHIIKVDYEKRVENVQLHGCCLVLSQKYINYFEGLNEKTFLYLEEAILYTEVIMAKMKTVYNPNLIIFHKEDGATDSILKTGILKRRFIYKNSLQSAAVLKQLIEKS
jgi:GT2 family glycosyltransferase